MPRRSIPTYRCFKPKNLGLFVIDGKPHDLGRYGSPESVAEYNRLVQERLSRGSRPRDKPRAGDVALTVDDLLVEFWTRHAEKHDRRPDGSVTGEPSNFRDSLRPMHRLYGPTPASDFSPLKLKAVRQPRIDSGLSRGTINQRVGRIVRLDKWAASEELVPAGVSHALKTVTGLPKGRTDPKETQPVRPVTSDAVEAIRPLVARQVWAMIELQRLTGMRPGEVVVMRTCDLDTSGEVWVFTPPAHKTAHRGREARSTSAPAPRKSCGPGSGRS